MKRISMVLSVLGTVAIVGCSGTVSVDRDAELESLRKADVAYSNATTAADVEGVMSMYSADAIICPPNEDIITGTEGIRSFATQVLGGPGYQVTFELLNAEVSNHGDLGYTVNSYVIKVIGPQGQPVEEEGRDIRVWRKNSYGSWKIAIDTWNSDKPLEQIPEQLSEGD